MNHKAAFLADLKQEFANHTVDFTIERHYLDAWYQLFTNLPENAYEAMATDILCTFGTSRSYPIAFAMQSDVPVTVKHMPFQANDPKYQLIMCRGDEGEAIITDLRADGYYFVTMKGTIDPHLKQRVTYIPYRSLSRLWYVNDFSYAYHYFLNEYNFINGFLMKQPLKRFKLMKQSSVTALTSELIKKDGFL